MKNEQEQLRQGRRVLLAEGEAIVNLSRRIAEDSGFSRAVELLFSCKGKVVLTGVGKAGVIARKISGTLASTGTLSIFLHPVEALHGDLGRLQREDVVVALSNSGSSDEILRLASSHTLEHPTYNLPVKILRGMALAEIAAEKVRALITRDKARDLYDLAYLIDEKRVPFDAGLIAKKLGFYGRTYSPRALEENVDNKKRFWKGELQQLIARPLPPFEQARKIVLDW